MKKYKGVELSLQVQRMTRIEFFNSNYSFFKKDIKVREDGSKVWTSNGGSIEIDIYKDGSFSIGIKKKKGMSSTTQKYFLTIKILIMVQGVAILLFLSKILSM